MVESNSLAESRPEAAAEAAPASAVGAGRFTDRIRQWLANPIAFGAIVVILAAASFVGVRYVQDLESKVYVEDSEITAPTITIGPEIPGVLKMVYVKEGDRVAAGQQLFGVGDNVVTARVPGVITSVQNTPGQWVSQASAVVQMYEPTGLRVVAKVQENQGLSDIRVGQKAIFTVDAYGDQQFEGTVDSIATNADSGNLVFSISETRQENKFDVKIAFDPNAYPQLRNGMSAKVWVLK